MRKSLLWFVMTISLYAHVDAAQVQGGFTGTIYQSYGVFEGVDLSTFVGKEVRGVFSFDPATLDQNSSTLTSSIWSSGEVYGNALVPDAMISQEVDGHVFTLQGRYISTVSVGTNHFGLNFFGMTVAPSQFASASIGFGNTPEGSTYISDLNDPTTINFDVTDLAGYSLVTNFGPSAAYYFSPVSAWATHSAVPVAEPASALLFLAGVAGLGALRRRTVSRQLLSAQGRFA